MVERKVQPATGAAGRRNLPAPLTYGLVLLPVVVFYLYFLLSSRQTYLLRRDENIMLVIFAELQRGRPMGEIFTMIITPGFLTITAWLARMADVLLVGRALAMLSALGCALLTALIARRLFGGVAVPLLALALILGSALLVEEGTIFRLNLLSLALALAAILLLLTVSWASPRRDLAVILFAGLLCGVALQVKALVLALAPFILFLLYRIVAAPAQRPARPARALLVILLQAGGWLLPSLLATALIGPDGSRIERQLGSHLEAQGFDLAMRVSHSAATTAAFGASHLWLVLFFAGALYRAFALPAGRAERAPLSLVAAWAGSVLAVLVLNFPSWDHHYVYLLPPLALGAATFLAAVGRAACADAMPAPGVPPSLAVLCLAIAAGGTFVAAGRVEEQEVPTAAAAAARLIEQRTAPQDVVWSDNLVFPLLTGRATDPALIDFSLKRILAGQLTEAQLFALFARRPPAAVIAYDGLFDAFPQFIGCLSESAEVSPIVLGSQRIYWVRPSDIALFKACQARAGL